MNEDEDDFPLVGIECPGGSAGSLKRLRELLENYENALIVPDEIINKNDPKYWTVFNENIKTLCYTSENNSVLIILKENTTITQALRIGLYYIVKGYKTNITKETDFS